MTSIDIASPQRLIHYKDTEDHFENGLLRLLSLDKALFSKWLHFAEQSTSENILERLKFGFANIKTMPKQTVKQYSVHIPGPKGEEGNIWYDAIAENPSFGIVRSLDNNLAWLFRCEKTTPIREVTPPVYEESYFEGDKKIAGGYGQYIAQADWRLEKAARQVKELSAVTNLKKGHILDLGSGYGYFRKALEDAEFTHSGIEISQHAIKVAQGLFGFETYAGVLADYTGQLKEKFDVVTLWDVIEHVPNPEVLLKDINDVLKPGGFAIIKTPNINCPEVSVFGPYYHSFKREHLIYFSADSLTKYANAAGFDVHYATSISHLLSGFVGEQQTKVWANNLQGADLLFYLKKR